MKGIGREGGDVFKAPVPYLPKKEELNRVFGQHCRDSHSSASLFLSQPASAPPPLVGYGPIPWKLPWKPVNPKGNQSWIFIGRTDAEAEAQHFGHLMRRAGSLEKTLILGMIEEKGTTENEMAGWHHQLNVESEKLWEIVKERETWCAAVHGVTESEMTYWLNSNPQSCLENPMDREQRSLVGHNPWGHKSQIRLSG